MGASNQESVLKVVFIKLFQSKLVAPPVVKLASVTSVKSLEILTEAFILQ